MLCLRFFFALLPFSALEEDDVAGALFPVFHPFAAVARRFCAWTLVFYCAVASFYEVAPFQLAAAFVYYMLLSLAPLVLVTITIASFFFGRESVQARLVTEVEKAAGPAVRDVVADIVKRTASGASGWVLAIGIVTVLI